MPYAIYSKRTRIVTRIVHDLSGVLPSESSLEIDNASSFPRAVDTKLLGQSVDTLGLKRFDMGGVGSSVTEPSRWGATPGRRQRVKHAPVWVQYDQINPKMDFPIHAHPFVWSADALAAAKYEAMLAKNAPYQVLVGEEWLGVDEIDPVSHDFVLSEGKCILNPGGVLQTAPMYFFLQKNVAHAASDADTFDHFNLFACDAYYLTITPDLNPGIKAEIQFMEWSEPEFGYAKHDPGGIGNDEHTLGVDPILPFSGAITDEEMDLFFPQKGLTPFWELTNDTSVVKAVRLRFENTTEDAFAMESYVLMLRLKDPTHHPAGSAITGGVGFKPGG